VLITGATKGIGLATSLLLSRNGYNVIGIARHPDKEFPGTLFLCDLSYEKSTAEVIQAITSSYSIDAIVNNVGISSPEPLGKSNRLINPSFRDKNFQVLS